MQRDHYQKLLAWKAQKKRKPLILQGARQVGKTYLIKAFGQQEFSDLAIFNFETDPKLGQFFEDKLSPEALLKSLSIYREKPITPKTLIFFDEIQACDRALTSLKYFAEKSPKQAIIAAGSLLGLKLKGKSPFPVGKVHFQTLYPLSFLEFLTALKKNMLRDYLEKQDRPTPLPEPIHQELLQHLRYYYFVGGMPEAVASFVQDEDLPAVRQIHRDILLAYQADFSKYAEASDIIKIHRLWELIPKQLAKENKKFMFAAIKKSARAREYENALQWLIDAGLVYKSSLLSNAKLPLKAYAQENIFKIFLLDVGLLATQSQLAIQTLLEKNELFTEFHGALTENFVAQELKAYGQEDLHYWTSGGRAEVDFLSHQAGAIYPLEVKAGRSRYKKSLKLYQEKYPSQKLSRASQRNLKQDGELTNYPLYGLCRFPALSA